MTPEQYWTDKLFQSEAIGELVRIDLMKSHEYTEYTEDDWKLKDALRQVVKYYSSPSQYEEFMRRNDESCVS